MKRSTGTMAGPEPGRALKLGAVLAALVLALPGCAVVMESMVDSLVDSVLDPDEADVAPLCRADSLVRRRHVALAPGEGILGVPRPQVVDRRSRGDTLLAASDVVSDLDDYDASTLILNPGLARLARRDFRVLLEAHQIMVRVQDSLLDVPGEPVLEVSLVRSELTLRVKAFKDQLHAVAVADVAAGVPGQEPSWLRTFVGDTGFTAALSSTQDDYRRAFGAAWCQVLRQAREAMDSVEFREAFIAQDSALAGT